MSRSSNDNMRERLIEAGIDPDWHLPRPGRGSKEVDINIDLISTPGCEPGCEQRVREIVADHQGRVIYVNPDGPGGGNPNFGIRARSIESARQLVKELLGDPSLTDDEIDDLFIVHYGDEDDDWDGEPPDFQEDNT